MASNYTYQFPYNRQLTANTLCIVGVCTCIMMKMAVEAVFDSLGITDYSVEPATEDNPLGSRGIVPDVIFCEALRLEEIKSRIPGPMIIEVKDVANRELIKEEVIKAFSEAGWLVENA